MNDLFKINKMNIYLHIEISSRELDSKLLLAVLAAARGHKVVISSSEIIEKGLKKGWLPPGIFHTKSLTPGENKIKRHQSIIDNGSKITSIDEESSIDRFGYEEFSKLRYSKETIDQSSAVFTWGDEDFEMLKKQYSDNSEKIFKTGSPRIDLWRPSISEYWNAPKSIPKKPFLLVSSNLASIFDSISLKERISMMKDGGYFDRSPGFLKKKFLRLSGDFNKAIIFTEAIKHLSKYNNGYDIVVRPHPIEDIEIWKILLDGIPNVHIIREGAISSWVKKSFAVMHHACTTAIECTISNKPLVTYAASELEDHLYQNNLSNQLGYIVDTKEKLLDKINYLNQLTQNENGKTTIQSLPPFVLKKVYIDKNELSAEKIVKIWENILNDKIYKPVNLTLLKIFILKMNINRLMGDFLKIFFKSSLSSLGTKKNNQKFPKINQTDINYRITKLQNLLKIKKKIEYKLISDRTLLIRCL